MIPIEQSQDNQYRQLAGQAGRFVVVGVINTTINFAVLNLLSSMTGVESGSGVILIAAAAFALANVNSYIMNKYWSFQDRTTGDHGRKFVLFLLVSVGGAAIQSSIVYAITTFMAPVMQLSGSMWLNVANAVGIGVSLVWNFFGYRYVVFKP